MFPFLRPLHRPAAGETFDNSLEDSHSPCPRPWHCRAAEVCSVAAAATWCWSSRQRRRNRRSAASIVTAPVREGGVEVEGDAAVVAVWSSHVQVLLGFLTHNAIVLSSRFEISWRDIKCSGNIDLILFALFALTNWIGFVFRYGRRRWWWLRVSGVVCSPFLFRLPNKIFLFLFVCCFFLLTTFSLQWLNTQ